MAEAHDGAVLVTEDGNGTVWRIAPDSRPARLDSWFIWPKDRATPDDPVRRQTEGLL